MDVLTISAFLDSWTVVTIDWQMVPLAVKRDIYTSKKSEDSD